MHEMDRREHLSDDEASHRLVAFTALLLEELVQVAALTDLLDDQVTLRLVKEVVELDDVRMTAFRFLAVVEAVHHIDFIVEPANIFFRIVEALREDLHGSILFELRQLFESVVEPIIELSL